VPALHAIGSRFGWLESCSGQTTDSPLFSYRIRDAIPLVAGFVPLCTQFVTPPMAACEIEQVLGSGHLDC
jgi:hypothetical protein